MLTSLPSLPLDATNPTHLHYLNLAMRGSAPAPTTTTTSSTSTTSKTRQRDSTLPQPQHKTPLLPAVRVKIHRVGFRKFRDTFSGHDAIAWMLEHALAATTAQAQVLGEALVAAGYVEPVRHFHNSFVDKAKHLFKFVAREDDEVVREWGQQGGDDGQVEEEEEEEEVEVSVTRSESIMSMPEEMGDDELDEEELVEEEEEEDDAPATRTPSPTPVARPRSGTSYGLLPGLGIEDIEALASRMIADPTFEVKDRKYLLRTYEKCFVGTDAVSWLLRDGVRGLVKTAEDAAKVCQMMMYEGVFHHVSRKPRSFSVGKYFYRFSVDEPDGFRLTSNDWSEKLHRSKTMTWLASTRRKIQCGIYKARHRFSVDGIDGTDVSDETEVSATDVDEHEDTGGAVVLTSEELSQTVSVNALEGAKAYIKVRVVEARNLRRANPLLGSSNPYVQVYVEGHAWRTRTVHNTVDPQWNDLFQSPLVLYGQTLQLAVFSENRIAADRLLGVVFITMSSLANDAVLDRWFPLQPRPGKHLASDSRKGVTGELHLQIEYHFNPAAFVLDLPSSFKSTVDPVFMKEWKKSRTFSPKRMALSFARLGALARRLDVGGLSDRFKALRRWENPTQSLLAVFVWVVCCVFLPPQALAAAVPGLLLAVLSRNYISESLLGATREEVEDESAESERIVNALQAAEMDAEMESDSDSGQGDGFVGRVSRIQRSLNEAHRNVLDVVEMLERLESLLTWQHQHVSKIFACGCGLMVAVLLLLPFRLLLLSGGLFVLCGWLFKTPEQRAKALSGADKELGGNPLSNLVMRAPVRADLTLNEKSIVHSLMHARM